jgi:hypothetical protein
VHFLLTEEFDFVRASQVAGLTVQRLRDELGKPHVLKHLRAEKRAMLEAACANNPVVLTKIRDHGKNDAARVRAVVASEALLQQATQESVGAAQKMTPGLVIIVGSRDAVTVDQPRRLAGARTVIEAGAYDPTPPQDEADESFFGGAEVAGTSK